MTAQDYRAPSRGSPSLRRFSRSADLRHARCPRGGSASRKWFASAVCPNYHAFHRGQGRTRPNRSLLHNRPPGFWQPVSDELIQTSSAARATSNSRDLIPVKNLSAAKQRLAAVLDQPARTELAQTMLRDVVTAIAAWPRRPACALVTSDPYAVSWLGSMISKSSRPREPGETGAIEMATRLCVERGIDSTLVIPADIPLYSLANSIRSSRTLPLKARAGACCRRRGTNAAFRRPQICFPALRQ